MEGGSPPGPPHEIRIDLGETRTFEGFTYLPRGDQANGTILKYEFYVSRDFLDWGSR